MFSYSCSQEANRHIIHQIILSLSVGIKALCIHVYSSLDVNVMLL
jgi:hypothetical protein